MYLTLGATTQQYVSTGVQTGGAAATAIGTAMHAAWVPVVGPIVAGVTIALALIFARKGPGQKVASTHIVDDLEPQLQENLRGYMAGPRILASQAQALKNFDDAWAYLESAAACGAPELGNPGKACIQDRQPGGKWDWFSYYRDPIAQDTAAAGLMESIMPQGSQAPLLIGLALVGAALLI